jgi:3-dehydroquinate dehydratase/shikimate dehydrogenase
MHTLLFGVVTDLSLEIPGSIDGIELRLDYFDQIDLKALRSFLQKVNLPVMLAVRRADQGGKFLGTEGERLALIESLCSLRPAYIDLEYDVPNEYRKRLFESYPEISFLSSYHNFSNTPDNLEELYKEVKTPYAHILKLATTAQSSLDALRLLSFIRARSSKEKIIGVAMGEEGRATRILAPVVGSFLTYAPLSEKTAPGQLSAQELQEIYHFGKLNQKTQIYCLIGDPVEKSLSAVIHNAVFEKFGVNAVYIKLKVKREELPAFFSQAQELPFQGFSITMPLKEAVMPLLTAMSSQTQAIGACNTIKIDKSQLIGYNTDGIGALNALEKKGAVLDKQIVIIGAGGAAKALAYEAIQRGAQVTLLNRTPSKAIAIAEALGATQGGGLDLAPQSYDILINCTPESQLISEEWVLPGTIAMDIVNVPKNTSFLVKALSKQCALVFGYEMFTAQALEQQLIWFQDQIDQTLAHAIIEKTITENLR